MPPPRAGRVGSECRPTSIRLASRRPRPGRTDRPPPGRGPGRTGTAARRQSARGRRTPVARRPRPKASSRPSAVRSGSWRQFPSPEPARAPQAAAILLPGTHRAAACSRRTVPPAPADPTRRQVLASEPRHPDRAGRRSDRPKHAGVIRRGRLERAAARQWSPRGRPRHRNSPGKASQEFRPSPPPIRGAASWEPLAEAAAR